MPMTIGMLSPDGYEEGAWLHDARVINETLNLHILRTCHLDIFQWSYQICKFHNIQNVLLRVGNDRHQVLATARGLTFQQAKLPLLDHVTSFRILPNH